MNKTVSVPIGDIIKEKRFNPKYFYFLENRNLMLESRKNDIHFEYLGNEDYVSVLTDGIHSAVDFDKKSRIKYLYVSNLNEGFIDITDNNFLSSQSLNDNPSKVLLKNDVLLSVVGRVGETAMMSNYVCYKTSLPRNIAFMRTNSSKLLPEFLTCYFLSDFAREQCVYSGGGNLQKLISLTKLKKFVFPVVKMEVQEEFKQLYNKAIEKQNDIILNINESKNLLSDKLKVKKILDNDNNYANVNISSIKKQAIWTPNLYDRKVNLILEELTNKFITYKLEDISIPIKKGNEIGSVNYKDYLSKTSSDVPFIRTSDIYNYEISTSPSYYANKDIYYELNQDFKERDIIFNNDGRIGYPSILTSVDTNCIFQSHIRRIRLKNKYKYLTNYLFICLLVDEVGRIQFYKNTVVQSTIPTLSNRANNFIIPIVDEDTINLIDKKVNEAINAIIEKNKLMEKIKRKMNTLLKY